MPRFTDRLITKFSQEQLFNLVIDIEQYPLFIPWCAGARIIEKEEKKIIAELLVKFSSFREQYTSLVEFEYPHIIIVSQTKGPFKKLLTKWQFNKIDDKNTELIFEIDFEFASKILDNLIGTVFEQSTQKFAKAFVERAHLIY